MNFQNEHKSAEDYNLFSKVEKLPEKVPKNIPFKLCMIS